jgi:hypothetical protein
MIHLIDRYFGEGTKHGSAGQPDELDLPSQIPVYTWKVEGLWYDSVPKRR